MTSVIKSLPITHLIYWYRSKRLNPSCPKRKRDGYAEFFPHRLPDFPQDWQEHCVKKINDIEVKHQRLSITSHHSQEATLWNAIILVMEESTNFPTFLCRPRVPRPRSLYDCKCAADCGKNSPYSPAFASRDQEALGLHDRFD